MKRTLSSPGPLLLALAFSAYAIQYGAFMGFLPTLLIEDLGVSHTAAASLSAAMIAANVPGNLLASRLLKQGVGRTALIMAACLIMETIFSPVLLKIGSSV